MPTVTLMQAAGHPAANIVQITLLPMGVVLAGLAGGPLQFTCTNAQATIQTATQALITYTGPVGGHTETLAVSSVQA
ncbi:hypothetical protein [Pseudoduganella violacea]|uniref:Uncharacterized protein n=1 Tax=Pseudoduganella violacea TaxID=1715466 RepID=A0A7W5FW19_9BURK|nr:hypothetical protein [Pseudoduganella violacea]MBB3121580.1 hypothetical protein [Pseudoduganella violacea]